MSDDKILYFPGFEPADRVCEHGVNPSLCSMHETAPAEPAASPLPEGAELLSPEMQKAVGIVESGMPFLIVGMRPTPGGCDFLSAVVGDRAVVGPAARHLLDMAARCLRRAGYEP